MYTTVLLIHSWVRWAVILTGLVASGRAIVGWFAGKPWTRSDERAGIWFASALDLQFLLGLLLYFLLSPITGTALRDFGGAMANASLRFWAVEHVVGMVLAIVFAHVGRARLRRIGADARRHRVAAIFFTLAILSILASIPWPGMANGRPLFRW